MTFPSASAQVLDLPGIGWSIVQAPMAGARGVYPTHPVRCKIRGWLDESERRILYWMSVHPKGRSP